MFEYLNIYNLILGIPLTFLTYISISMIKEYYLQIKKSKKSKKSKKNHNKKSQ